MIQPQVPLRLPCYDLVPIIELTFGASLLAVSVATSGPPNFRGLTSGVCQLFIDEAMNKMERSIRRLYFGLFESHEFSNRNPAN